MKKHFTTIVLIFVFLAGLSLLLYPTVSDWWNSFHQTRAIASYSESVSELDDEDKERMRQEAAAYNASLIGITDPFLPAEAEHLAYEQLLDVSGTGIMGHIEIPSIHCELPFYHGVEEGVLSVAVGHIEGSSLPVGGEGTHCVLSGHRGLPSAKLFTDLDQLKEGDVFLLHVLDEILAYEVDRILIVEPDDVGALAIDAEKDLCTLVTCTPYGVNTHRLLVTGHRVENLSSQYYDVASDAVIYDPVMIAPLLAIPVLILLFIIVLVKKPKKTPKE